MNNYELLQVLASRIAQGELTQAEVMGVLDGSVHPGQVVFLTKPSSGLASLAAHFSVTKMLYALGAGIVVTGIVLFVIQIWDDLGMGGQIVITLGLGLLFAVLGSVLLKQKPAGGLGAVFHTIGGVLIPGGAAVTLDVLAVESLWAFALTSVSIFGLYLLLNSVHKHAVLTFFAIVTGTGTAYLVAAALLDPMLNGNDMEVVLQYLTIVLGVSYLLLARAFASGWNQLLLGSLHFFGALGLLGAAFIRVLEQGIWELLFFGLVAALLYVSVKYKSRSILILSMLFLLAHVTFITSEYFADSIGWPLALMLLGFVLIGLGYASVTINSRYMKERS